MIVWEQRPELLEFANQVLDVEFQAGQCVWISRLNPDGSPLAVVVFDRFSAFNCEMSIASDRTRRWFSREFVGVCFRYAFKQMDLRRVTVVVDETNEKSLKMCRQLGYVQEGRLVQWFGETDGIAFRMLKEECRWI